jgi:uncharacterized protein (DUF885 family)
MCAAKEEPAPPESKMQTATYLLFSLLVAALLLPPLSMTLTAQERRNSTSYDNQATKALNALFAAEWDYQLEQNPTRASSLGDRRWNDRWEDATVAAIQKRHEHNLQTLAQLKAIDRSQLSPPDQLNYDLFKKDYETDAEEYEFRWYLVPLNQREGIQTADDLADSLRFETVKDYEDWIARLRSLPAYVDQTTALMREGIRQRVLLPKIIMQRVPAQIDKQLVADPQQSLFYKPFTRFSKNIPEAERERLSQAAREAIASGVIPAYKRFKEFFTGEYLPASFEQVGAWQMARGPEMYAFFVRKYTTTNLTPREVHEIGLKEVQRIRGKMQAIMEKVGFKGTLQEFFKFLRTDPRFYYRTPAELFEAYQAMAKTIDPRLVKVFKT